jgi:hypothetical protein
VVNVSDDGNIPNFLHVRFLKSGAKVRREVASSTRWINRVASGEWREKIKEVITDCFLLIKKVSQAKFFMCRL